MDAKRMMTVAALAIGLGALGTGAALAGEGSGQSQPRKAKSEDSSRQVCRTVIPSGSRLGNRVCQTQKAWDEARDKAQNGVLQSQMRDQSTYTPTTTSF